MKAVVLSIALAAIAISRTAAAQDNAPATTEAKDTTPTTTSKRVDERKVAITPLVGAAFGTWLDLDVTRGVAGLELADARPSAGFLRATGSLLLEPGETRMGLGAHRIELGAGVSTRPWWLRFGVGAHVSYAMLVRVTVDDAFIKALFGNIGAFGIGLHATLDSNIPLTESATLVLGVRATADVYDGGSGMQLGPMLGVRF